jgi:NAD(P)-dependent dehydrogenase (short-subunit alcohol dehydrogenase family)
MAVPHTTHEPPAALVTGASLGLGRALARALAGRGWSVVADARGGAALAEALGDLQNVTALAGDVTDPEHRAALAAAVERLGRLDVLVNNASALGPSPLPRVREYPVDQLREVFETNVVAPLALVQLLAGRLAAARGAIVNVSSDASVEAYQGWGGYGSAKAALDQLTNVLGEEEQAIACYAFDPGDMRTQMHQAAFPGEDISDRPEPESVVPALMRLLDQRPPSGRYRAAELMTTHAEVTP